MCKLHNSFVLMITWALLPEENFVHKFDFYDVVIDMRIIGSCFVLVVMSEVTLFVKLKVFRLVFCCYVNNMLKKLVHM